MLDALDNIGDFLGGIGVVVTLLYLAAQIRQNTRMMRGAARQQLAQTSQDTIYRWADYAPAVVAAFGSNELEPADELRVRQLCRGMFRGWENYAYQHRIGLVDLEEWAGVQVTIRKMLAHPTVAEYWSELRDEYSKAFVEEIESVVVGEK